MKIIQFRYRSAPFFQQNIQELINMQGSPHLQKTGRLDDSLRDHEGEVKA